MRHIMWNDETKSRIICLATNMFFFLEFSVSDDNGWERHNKRPRGQNYNQTKPNQTEPPEIYLEMASISNENEKHHNNIHSDFVYMSWKLQNANFWQFFMSILCITDFFY